MFRAGAEGRAGVSVSAASITVHVTPGIAGPRAGAGPERRGNSPANRPGVRTKLAHSWHNGGSPVKPD